VLTDKQSARMRRRKISGVVAILVLLGLVASSHTHVDAAGVAPTLYTPTFQKNVVFTVNVTDSAVIVTNGVATVHLADVSNLAEAQYGQLIVDCTAASFPAGMCLISEAGAAGTGHTCKGRSGRSIPRRARKAMSSSCCGTRFQTR